MLPCMLKPSAGQHMPVPSESALLKALRFELELTDDHIFMKHLDTCTQINHSLVYSVCTKGGDLWLMLAFQKSGPIYACLPVVEETLEPQPPLLTVSGLLQGLAFLLGIVGYISSSWKNEAECENRQASKFAYTDLFGTPLNTNIHSLNSWFDDIQEIPTDKNQLAWRSSNIKANLR